MFDFHNIRHIGRIMHLNHLTIIHVQVINHRWRSCNQVNVKFAFNTFADYLQMQQTKKPAPETKPQSGTGLHFKFKARIIKA